MNMKQIKKIFKEKIKPELVKPKPGKKHKRRIDKPEKYIGILYYLVKCVDNSKGLRASDFPKKLQPVSHMLSRFAETGVVQKVQPGHRKLLWDPVNNKTEFNIRKIIQDYVNKLQEDFRKRNEIKECLKRNLKLSNESHIEKWLNSLSLEKYNSAIAWLLRDKVDIKKKGYGPLYWRNVAFLYRLSKHGKGFLGLS